jgi:hypothetical protein
MDIRLNFINQSKSSNVDIVIFQKNLASRIKIAVAWQVITNSTPGSVAPFSYSPALEVAANDSYGNTTPRLPASNGKLFQVSVAESGDELSYVGPASSQQKIEVQNNLSVGSINANIYRNGQLLATKTGMTPGQKAVFQFKPTIWIGVVSQVVQGEIMDSAIISQINTELSLLDITTAGIIMTGGGPGPTSQPFKFSLANVMHAV